MYMGDGSLSVDDVAKALGLGISSVRGWSQEEGWKDKRIAHWKLVSTSVVRAQLKQRVADLKDWNDKDLTIAKAIRFQVATAVKMLEGPMTLKYMSARMENLKTLASVLEITQRVARIAIGVGIKGSSELSDEGDDSEQVTSVTVNIKSARLRNSGEELPLPEGDDLGDGSGLDDDL